MVDIIQLQWNNDLEMSVIYIIKLNVINTKSMHDQSKQFLTFDG